MMEAEARCKDGNVIRRAGGHPFAVAAAVVACASFAMSTPALGGAASVTLPPNDLTGLVNVLVGGQVVPRVQAQTLAGPALAAVPPAQCDAASDPIEGEQGRVTAADLDAAAGKSGYTCNLSLVSHQGSSGGLKVYRYVDQAGHVCAYYDTTVVFPLNVVSLAGPPSTGVAVLDMDDPAHPVQSDTLTSLVMLSPHESLNLNVKRGLLAADLGNAATAPGLIAVYDLSHDCRHPVLDSTYLAARFGHESAFSADGNTFWVNGAIAGTAAVDVSDPKHPRTIWQSYEPVHGGSVSDDGDTYYASDPINGDLTILDVSQIQNRAANPQATEISRSTWPTVSIPQNTDPMEIDGKPYLLEYDEFGVRVNPPAYGTDGAARIIDISDPVHPQVVSNLRLAVDMPGKRAEAAGDPQPLGEEALGYGAHYCAIPREVDPEIAACSFLNSGLRIFNIQDPLHPREVAYFVAPKSRSVENGLTGSNWALSKPAFDPADDEVWYTDGPTGFYALKLDPGIWPQPAAPSCQAAAGRMAAGAIGPIRLGQTRASARRAITHLSARSRPNLDYLCLTGGGIRAGYAAGRVVLELTSNQLYSVDRVHAGAALTTVPRRLRSGVRYRVGRNTWYLARDGAASIVLEVQRGFVAEIGYADTAATATGAAASRFFRAFG
jgi:hypothetical protein